MPAAARHPHPAGAQRRAQLVGGAQLIGAAIEPAAGGCRRRAARHCASMNALGEKPGSHRRLSPASWRMSRSAASSSSSSTPVERSSRLPIHRRQQLAARGAAVGDQQVEVPGVCGRATPRARSRSSRSRSIPIRRSISRSTSPPDVVGLEHDLREVDEPADRGLDVAAAAALELLALALRGAVGGAERPVVDLERVVGRALQAPRRRSTSAPGSGARAPSARAPGWSAGGRSAPATRAGSAAAPERSNRSAPSSPIRNARLSSSRRSARALTAVGRDRSHACRRLTALGDEQPVERRADRVGELRRQALEGLLVRALARPRDEPHQPRSTAGRSIRRRRSSPHSSASSSDGPLVLERALDQPRRGPARASRSPAATKPACSRTSGRCSRRVCGAHRVVEDRPRRHVERVGERARSPPAARPSGPRG